MKIRRPTLKMLTDLAVCSGGRVYDLKAGQTVRLPLDLAQKLVAEQKAQDGRKTK